MTTNYDPNGVPEYATQGFLDRLNKSELECEQLKRRITVLEEALKLAYIHLAPAKKSIELALQ